ncbi:MAG: transketolase [Anaerolineales bacterium]|nr:transketolase [Anaerolineales bacterium]
MVNHVPQKPVDVPTIQELKEKARDLRLDVVEMTTRARSGHPSSCLSAVEIVTVLFWGGFLRFHSSEPHWPARDRFIMSKGHAAPLLYAALAHAGYFDREQLWRLRQIDSPVQGHPIQDMMPGVEATTGSLGQGLSIGLGHVIGGRLNQLDYRVYVLLGDGECEAGQVWEAAMAASHFKAENLIAIVDYNKYQETGPISREMALEPFARKWRAFGWHVDEVDGHNIQDILNKLNTALQVRGKPSVIIAHTVKGKGVSILEADYTYHGRALTPEQAVKAREEIACS